MLPSQFSPEAQQTLRSIAPEQVQLEQYMDFLRNRMFRQSLLVRPEVRPNYTLQPDVILMGSGTEIQWCVGAYEKLKAEGIKVRIVSMPCWQIFEEQDAAYKETVLPAGVTARVSIEMAATFGWDRYIGAKGKAIGMHSFGASAPLKDLLKRFGFGVDEVVAAAKQVLGK